MTIGPCASGTAQPATCSHVIQAMCSTGFTVVIYIDSGLNNELVYNLDRFKFLCIFVNKVHVEFLHWSLSFIVIMLKKLREKEGKKDVIIMFHLYPFGVTVRLYGWVVLFVYIVN